MDARPALAALLAGAAVTAHAQVFQTTLAPEAAGASGSGSVVLGYDALAHTLSIDASWSGLSGPTQVAHIHCCVAPPGTVGVAVTPGTLPGFPTGVTAGAYDVVLDLTQTASYASGFLTLAGGSAMLAEAALVGGLQEGRAYFNIHTATFPAGEIRGFLAPVPEPASGALAATGLAAVAALAARRRDVPGTRRRS